MLAKEKAWQTVGYDTNPDQSVDGEYVDQQLTTFTSEDRRLIEKLRAGDQEAFVELVTIYQPMLYRLLIRIVRDPEEARDLTQETFLKVYRKIGGFRGESGLRTWIFRIAVNQALKSQRWWNRRRRRETSSLDAVEQGGNWSLAASIASRSASPEADALAVEQTERIERALMKLKKDFQVVILLRDIEGLRYDEIAEVLGITLGTVKSRIARGREMLRDSLEGL